MNHLKSVLFLYSGIFFLFFSCSPARNGYRRAGRQVEKEVRKSPVFNRAFTGFTLVDPETGRSLADVNGDHFFTPASTTKILTLYTCLKVLGDSVPGLKIQVSQFYDQDSTLLIMGTCDPTFLHPSFQAWQMPFQYLSRQKYPISMIPNASAFRRFGPGWAWDDYQYGFQPERHVFPMYGNVVQFLSSDSTFSIHPTFFKSHFSESPYRRTQVVERRTDENTWSVSSDWRGRQEEQWIPFIPINPDNLLTDTLGKRVEFISFSNFEKVNSGNWRTLYSAPLDTVLRRMMYQSDNFIAEQMLLICAGEKFNWLAQDTIIKCTLDSLLSDLPQRPRWVDGSGLSRYNLISPQDLSTVLLHLWQEEPHETLLSLFPAGGKDGTLADWYAGKGGHPYVFAKSGSMSGVTCLSGYVRTRHGKMLIFTFMTNHFVGSSRDWKVEMQRVLEIIHAW